VYISPFGLQRPKLSYQQKGNVEEVLSVRRRCSTSAAIGADVAWLTVIVA
jgi:hypothetical protein